MLLNGKGLKNIIQDSLYRALSNRGFATSEEYECSNPTSQTLGTLYDIVAIGVEFGGGKIYAVIDA